MLTWVTDISPEFGWNGVKPYFGIGVQRGSLNGFWFSLTEAREYDGSDVFLSGQVEGTVVVPSGGPQRVFGIQVYNLKPLTSKNCPAKNCIDMESLGLFSRGERLVIKGKTPKGELASITYDLRGYTNAASRMSSLCKPTATPLGATRTAAPVTQTAAPVQSSKSSYTISAALPALRALAIRL